MQTLKNIGISALLTALSLGLGYFIGGIEIAQLLFAITFLGVGCWVAYESKRLKMAEKNLGGPVKNFIFTWLFGPIFLPLFLNDRQKAPSIDSSTVKTQGKVGKIIGGIFLGLVVISFIAKPMLREKNDFQKALLQTCQENSELKATVDCKCYASEIAKNVTADEFAILGEIATAPEEAEKILIKRLGFEKTLALGIKMSAIEKKCAK